MKTNLQLFLFVILVFTAITTNKTFGQITITTSDMPLVGDVITQYTDTLIGVQGAGLAGSNQTWDYSVAINHDSTTSAFSSVASTPYAANFPSANIALTTDSNIYIYLNNQPTMMTFVGLAGTIINPGDIIQANPSQTLYQFPTSYLSNFTDTYYMEYEGDGSAFGVYAIRFVRHGVITDTTDAYGTLITPMGTYNSLRVKSWDNTIDSIFVKVLSDFEPWSLAQDTSNINLTYRWLANGTKLPAAEMTTTSSGTVMNDFTYTSIAGTFGAGVEEQALQKIKVGPNPASDVITIFIPAHFAESNLSLALMDINGKVLLNKNIQYSENIMQDVSFLGAGIYLYSITSGTETFVGKIIKE